MPKADVKNQRRSTTNQATLKVRLKNVTGDWPFPQPPRGHRASALQAEKSAQFYPHNADDSGIIAVNPEARP